MKSFTLCGFVHPDDFILEDLHGPLAECFKSEFDHEAWLILHGAAISGTADVLEKDNWTMYDDDHPLARAMYAALRITEEDYKQWHVKFKADVLAEILRSTLFRDLFDTEENKKFEAGSFTESKVDFAAAARVYKCKISLSE